MMLLCGIFSFSKVPLPPPNKKPAQWDLFEYKCSVGRGIDVFSAFVYLHCTYNRLKLLYLYLVFLFYTMFYPCYLIPW